jgi:hypothetical protein
MPLQISNVVDRQTHNNLSKNNHQQTNPNQEKK